MIPKRPRRAINQINVVPYIDVMLVLLVIFMVTAPFISPSQIDLPKVGQSSKPPAAPLEVMIKADGALLLRDRASGGEGKPITRSALKAEAEKLRKTAKDRPVVISADKSVRYESVMEVMDILQRNDLRVGLLVKPAQP